MAVVGDITHPQAMVNHQVRLCACVCSSPALLTLGPPATVRSSLAAGGRTRTTPSEAGLAYRHVYALSHRECIASIVVLLGCCTLATLTRQREHPSRAPLGGG